MEELQREMRTEEKKETRVLDTKPLDISGDFDDLSKDEGEELDLTEEAKKRAKK